jgi:hypothetical protein
VCQYQRHRWEWPREGAAATLAPHHVWSVGQAVPGQWQACYPVPRHPTLPQTLLFLPTDLCPHQPRQLTGVCATAVDPVTGSPAARVLRVRAGQGVVGALYGEPTISWGLYSSAQVRRRQGGDRDRAAGQAEMGVRAVWSGTSGIPSMPLASLLAAQLAGSK